MNKKLIAIAVASAMSVPVAVSVAPSTAQADGHGGPTIYGRLRGGLQRVDADGADENIGFEDASSRFGIRGEEDLGNGMSAIYRYEWATQLVEDEGSATGLGKRHSWVGLKGSFGQVTVGRQTNPFYGLTGTSYALGNEYTGNYAFYDAPGISDKFSDSINYRYSSGALEFGAGLIFDQSDAANEDLDGYNLAARYNFGPGRVSLGYVSIDGSSVDDDGVLSETESEGLAAFIDYNIGGGNAYIGVTQGEEDNTGVDTDGYHVGYGARSGNIGYFLSWDGLRPDSGGDRDIISWGINYFLSDRTRIYFEGDFLSHDDDDSDRNRQVLGIRHDF